MVISERFPAIPRIFIAVLGLCAIEPLLALGIRLGKQETIDDRTFVRTNSVLDFGSRVSYEGTVPDFTDTAEYDHCTSIAGFLVARLENFVAMRAGVREEAD